MVKKIIITIFLILVLIVAWYLASPLFLDKTVNEDLSMIEDNIEDVSFVKKGSFIDADDFHKGSGDAILYNLDQEDFLLRLENFEVTNGPDLYVLLSKSNDPMKDKGEYINLGKLKGNIGNQNYELPNNIDISEYESVIIYCKAFSVIFSTALLK